MATKEIYEQNKCEQNNNSLHVQLLIEFGIMNEELFFQQFHFHRFLPVILKELN